MSELDEIKERHKKHGEFLDAAGWCSSILDQDRATLLQMVDDRDKRIAELEAEIKDHAQWAEKMMADPKSEPYVKLLKRIEELEDVLVNHGICPKCQSVYSRRKGNLHCLNNVCLYQADKHKDTDDE